MCIVILKIVFTFFGSPGTDPAHWCIPADLRFWARRRSFIDPFRYNFDWQPEDIKIRLADSRADPEEGGLFSISSTIE